jgi:hypothetical protein
MMTILLIVLAVGVAGILIVDWAIYHSPIVDEDGHELAAERGGRWYPFKPDR